MLEGKYLTGSAPRALHSCTHNAQCKLQVARQAARGRCTLHCAAPRVTSYDVMNSTRGAKCQLLPNCQSVGALVILRSRLHHNTAVFVYSSLDKHCENRSSCFRVYTCSSFTLCILLQTRLDCMFSFLVLLLSVGMLRAWSKWCPGECSVFWSPNACEIRIMSFRF